MFQKPFSLDRKCYIHSTESSGIWSKVFEMMAYDFVENEQKTHKQKFFFKPNSSQKVFRTNDLLLFFQFEIIRKMFYLRCEIHSDFYTLFIFRARTFMN